ncbi:hypothetical protein C8J57DRAFT_1243514 [Mycena rebaudengoi]|nr:hypothetical protein C8J57DRAFT_1243514 [Mycena rebaudengoi]
MEAQSHGIISLERKHPLDGKGKEKEKAADSDSGLALVFDIASVPESWDVPAGHCVSYILDLSETPQLLSVGGNTLNPNVFVKKEHPIVYSRLATDGTMPIISGLIMAAKNLEAKSVAAVAVFYCGVKETYRKGTYLDSDIVCGGEAVLRKFFEDKLNSKAYFNSYSNWASGDSAGMSNTLRTMTMT